MQRLHIDIVGPLPRTKRGNRFIPTVQCSFTKWAETYVIPNQRASTCARVLVKNWICRFGVSDSIHLDQRRHFETQLFQETCMLLGINKTRSTAYHPDGNGQIENLHRTMKSMLTARAEVQPGHWDEQLDFCMMTHRSSLHSSTGHIPFELVFGREMRLPLDVMMGDANEIESNYTLFVVDLREKLVQAHQDVREKLKVAQRRQKDAFDKGVKYTVYQLGDLVLRFSSELKPGEPNKFHRNWDGPYEIVERVSEVTYRLQSIDRHSRRSSVFHFNNLRLYKRAPCVSSQRKEPVDSVRDNGDTLVDVSDQISVSGSEQNVSEAESLGDQTPVGNHRETVVIEDESSLPGVSIEERMESSPRPSDELPLSGQPSDVSSPSRCLEDTDLLLGGTLRPSRLRKPPDRYGDWVVNSVKTDGLFLDLLRGVEKLERKVDIGLSPHRYYHSIDLLSFVRFYTYLYCF